MRKHIPLREQHICSNFLEEDQPESSAKNNYKKLLKSSI